MARFVVTTREVYYCSYGVDADTEEEAIKIVSLAGGEMVNDSLEYSHTVAPGETYECKAWDVEKSE